MNFKLRVRKSGEVSQNKPTKGNGEEEGDYVQLQTNE